MTFPEARVTAGIDGCRAGWVVAGRRVSGAIDVCVYPSFAAILHDFAAGVLAIDIPIGLPERGARLCDRLARLRLGPRRASVFPAPARALLGAASYAEACAIGRELDGKAISRETWNICAKIADVDALITPALQQRVVEAHPELSFTMMQGGTPLTASKKTDEGRRQREALLYTHLQGAAAALGAAGPRGAAADDVLDALAVLWTAERYRCGRASVLTEDGACDERGLNMEIWF